MKLEEILKIDTEPFDEDILEDVYYRAYGDSTMMPDSFAALIFRYCRKFDEQYGTSLVADMVIERVLPEDAYDCDKLLWKENMDGVIFGAMMEGGWYMEWIGTYIEDLRILIEETGESEKEFPEAFKKFLDDIYEDCFVKSCLLEEKETIQEVCWLEDSMVGILWNSSLERYNQYRKGNEKVIATICPEEDKGIAILQDLVWEPYVMWHTQKTGVCKGKKYGLVILGCDGYNYCDTTDINPNWIFRIIKLGWLLKLAWEKIDCYEDEKRKKEAA